MTVFCYPRMYLSGICIKYVILAKAGIQRRAVSKEIFSSTRNIFAVCYVLQQICFIAALVYEQICCKALQTFGEKFPNVWKKTFPCSQPRMSNFVLRLGNIWPQTL